MPFTCCKLRVLISNLFRTCYLSLDAKKSSLRVAEVTRCKTSFVLHCKIRLLLLEEIASGKILFVSGYKNYVLLMAGIILSSLVMRITGNIVFLKSIKIKLSVFQNCLFPKVNQLKVVPSQHIMLNSVVSRALFNKTICIWVKTQWLLALSLKEMSKILWNLPPTSWLAPVNKHETILFIQS